MGDEKSSPAIDNMSRASGIMSPPTTSPPSGSLDDDTTRTNSPHNQNKIEDEETSIEDNVPSAPMEAEKNESGLIDWDGPDDPEHPLNWPFGKKAALTLAAGSMTFAVSFGSSVYSTAILIAAVEFEVSQEVMILGITLYVLGFALGPLFWGPISEIYGRRLPLFLGYTLFCIFNIPVAVAPDVATVMICRFFAGAFGSSTIGICGGMSVDVWKPIERGVAATFILGTIFFGPCLGPVVGGFITESYLGWRWTAWITLIVGCAIGIMGFFCIHESLPPYVLQQKAARLRLETKNWALHSPMDESPTNFATIVDKYLLLPPRMLIKEPILVLVTIYMSLVYGILYLTLEAYPISFEFERGWSLGVSTLPFIGVLIGVFIGCLIIIVDSRTRFQRLLVKHKAIVLPEERLPPMILGGCLLPAGLFWFAWTSSPDITWVPQAISGVFIGAGIILIFVQGLLYLIDTYLFAANSALAASGFVRSLVAAGFPLFAVQMYEKLGTPWATSLLGFLCVALIPCPILFYIYGKRIRAWSTFSYVL